MDRRRFIGAVSAAGIGTGGLGLGLLAGCQRTEAPAEAEPVAERSATQQELPKAIRLSPHGAWGSNKATGLMGILQSQGLLEQEFEREGIAIQWKPMDGGGIGINEALANGQVDVSSFGAFPQIIGHARGIRNRVLASQGYNNGYVVVRAGHPAQTPNDLRGATIAVSFGSWTHHAASMLLKEHGIPYKDVKLVHLDSKDTNAALATGKVDAAVGGNTLFSLQEQGLVRLIYRMDGRRKASAFGSLFATETFAERYPDTTRRIVKSYVRAMHWASQAQNHEAYLDYVTSVSTTPRRFIEQDFKDRDLGETFHPLLDDFYVAKLKSTVQFCLDNKIVREPIDVDRWVDRKTIADVVAELGLTRHWTAWDERGQPVPPGKAAHV